MHAMTFLILIFAIAFLLDLLFGDPHSQFHPVALFGRFAGVVELLCRFQFGNGVKSGFIAWFISVGVVTGLAFGITWILSALSWVSGVAAAGACLYVSIAMRSLLEYSVRIRNALERKDLYGARCALGMIVSRKTGSLSESDIVRGAIESIGENLIDAVNSACFWTVLGFLAGGVPGAAAGAIFLRAVNTLDACWGYKSEHYLKFGKVAARMDDVLHWIPARLTALAVAAAALGLGLRPVEALKMAWRHRKDHPSPNSCWGMATFAGALGIRLGGPTEYSDGREEYPYWGNGRKELNVNDLKLVEQLALLAAMIFAIFLLGVGLCLLKH